MPSSGITFKSFVMAPQPGHADERSPNFELPVSLVGYERSEKTLVVAAVRNSDGIIVGVGGGWLLVHSSKPDVLLVKTAEVNEPYVGTGLDRELIEAVCHLARQKGIVQVCIPAELQNVLTASASSVQAGDASPLH